MNLPNKISGYAVASMLEAKKGHVAVFADRTEAHLYKGKLEAANKDKILIISLAEETTTQRVIELTKKKLGVNSVIIEVV